jgi:hypothetical protein
LIIEGKEFKSRMFLNGFIQGSWHLNFFKVK